MASPPRRDLFRDGERSSAAAVRQSVERIVASPLFCTSPRLCRFLQYITEETLAERSVGIKEYSIGVDVYERGANFDPKIDAVVRVEAGRLRAKLARFYANAPADVPVRIELPKGTYVPVFGPVGQAEVATDAPDRRSRPGLVPATIALFAAALILVWFLVHQAHRAGPIRVAVLPLVSGGEPDMDRLATGLVEQLTGDLGGEGGFQVCSRSKTAAFSGSHDLAAIGAGLQVDAVMEGSLQRTDDGVRLSVHLVDVSDGFQLWSQTLDSTSGHLPDFQARAAALVTRTLRARFAGWNGRLNSPLTADREALSLYQKGNEAWLTQRRSGLEESVALYHSAIQRDPRFGKAYEGLAASELYLADLDRENAAGHVARAKEAALAALRLDDHLDDAHARLGNIYFRREWRLTEGEEHLLRSVVLAPGSAPPTRWYSLLARAHNRYSTAQEELQYGIMANPASEILQSELGLLHFQAGRFEEAEFQLRRAQAVDPNYPLTRQLAALLYEHAGRLEEAAAEFRACAGFGELHRYCLAGLGHVLAHSEKAEESRQIARRLAEADPPSLMLAAVVYAGLGDRERALGALEDGYRVHDLELPFCRLDPRLRVLREEPRFRAILSRLGLGT